MVRRLWGSEDGLSLIEITVSITLLGLVATGLVTAMGAGLRASLELDEQTTSATLITAQLEDTLFQAYVEPADYPEVSAPEGYSVAFDNFVIKPTLLESITVAVSSAEKDLFSITTHKINTGFVTSAPSLLPSQRDFAWYENLDDIVPTTPLEAENTPYTVAGPGQVVRLRISVELDSLPVPAGERAFKLQYATAKGGLWADVGGAASTTAVWRGYDNASVADGAPGASLLLSTSDVMESYEEENPSALNPNPVNAGDYAEWDWVIQENGASFKTNYLFRMVAEDGTPFESYARYPLLAVQPPVSFDQSDYRWFENQDSVGPGPALAPENTPFTGGISGRAYRLRVNVRVDGVDLAAGNQGFKLQYATSTTSTWTDMGAPGSAEAWRGFDNPTSTDGAILSTLLLSTSTVPATYEEQNPSVANPNSVDVGQLAEWDWVVQNNAAPPDTAYFFRIVKTDAAPLDGYIDYPELVTVTPVIASDDFETGDFSGGGGWLGPWVSSGDAEVKKQGQPQQGKFHLRLRRDTGHAARSVDLSAEGQATLELWAKADSFEPGETATLSVSDDGINFVVVHTWVDGDDDGLYYSFSFDLNSFSPVLSSTYWIAFDANMSHANDRFFIDDLELVRE